MGLKKTISTPLRKIGVCKAADTSFAQARHTSGTPKVKQLYDISVPVLIHILLEGWVEENWESEYVT